jgi:hypothetical protein
MGYSIYLIDRNKSIEMEDFCKACCVLPDRLKDPVLGCYVTDLSLVDYIKKEHFYVSVSGSYSISGNMADEMSLTMKENLDKLGYKIDRYSDPYEFDMNENNIKEWINHK